MNLGFDLQNYITNQIGLLEYEENIVRLNKEINAILDKQPDIIEYKEVEQLSGLYNEYESYLTSKNEVIVLQEALTRKINQTITDCFKGKSVVVKTELNEADEFYVIHPSMFEDELSYEPY